MSHISLQICSNSEGSSEAKIKLPKPVLTYVLAQRLTIHSLSLRKNRGVAHA